jgi:hypothetical protein
MKVKTKERWDQEKSERISVGYGMDKCCVSSPQHSNRF